METLGVLVALVFAGGHISGAHYNPAVTLAVLLGGRNKISLLDAGLYVIVQILGGYPKPECLRLTTCRVYL